MHIISAEIYIQ